MGHGNERLAKGHARALLVAWLWLLVSVVLYYFDFMPFAVAALIIMVVKLLWDAINLLNTDS